MATADDPKAPTVSMAPAAAAPASGEGAAPAEAVAAPAEPVALTQQEPSVSAPPSGLVLDRLDSALMAVVVLFAFVLALFPARNSDFLEHLATGRLIAQGQYHFGSDPFTLAGDKTGWVNHSWLFGLLAYFVYEIPGVGPDAVVVIKALGTAGMACLMLFLSRRPGRRQFVPALVTGLAVLALSPWLLLQPVVISYIFLVLTVWLLDRPRRLRERGGPVDAAPMAWFFLPVLFALWVNLDQWFFLGPVAVALYLAGELIQQQKGSKAGLLGAVLAVGVVACLLNPYHVHAFTLPAQLSISAGMDVLKDDGVFRIPAIAPLHSQYFLEPRLGLSAAGLAFFPLALFGAVSFGLTWGVVPWWRLTLWTGMLLLSLLHARAIPFFAVVAGPITALNVLDYLAMQAGADELTPRRYQIALAGRVVALALGALFVGAGTLGLLEARPQDERRLGAGYIVDPLMQAAAEEVHRIQEAAGPGTPLVCFNTNPTIVHYLAWFSPGVRGFADARLPEFPDAARDYLTVRKALFGLQDNVVPGLALDEEPAYQGFFRDWGVRCFLWQENDALRPENLFLLERLLKHPDEWPLRAVKGRMVVMGWHDPKTGKAAGSADLEATLAHDAFGPDVKPPPPVEAPEPTSEPSWWNVLLQGEPARSPHTPAASTYLALFEAASSEYRARLERDWNAARCAGLVAGVAAGAGPVGNGTLSRELCQPAFGQAFIGQHDGGPPAALYLAIRAARRALADNPNDARAYLVLGEAYSELLSQTREGTLASPLLQSLRETQAIACFQQVLNLNPPYRLDERRAHQHLATLFHRRRFQDLVIKHLTAFVGSLRETAQSDPRIEDMEKGLVKDQANLKSVEDRFELETAGNRHPIERAQVAMRYGLADKAVTLLQGFLQEQQEKGSTDQAVVVATNQLVGLLMAVGRIDEARALLDSPAKSMLGGLQDLQLPAYGWYMFELNAIAGNVYEAENYAAELYDRSIAPARMAVPFTIGQCLLSEALSAGITPYNVQRLTCWPDVPLPLRNPRLLAGQIAQQVIGSMQNETNLHLVRSVTFLEAGDLPRGRTELERALASNTAPVTAKAAARSVFDRRAEVLARLYLGWLDANAK